LEFYITAVSVYRAWKEMYILEVSDLLFCDGIKAGLVFCLALTGRREL